MSLADLFPWRIARADLIEGLRQDAAAAAGRVDAQRRRAEAAERRAEAAEFKFFVADALLKTLVAAPDMDKPRGARRAKR